MSMSRPPFSGSSRCTLISPKENGRWSGFKTLGKLSSCLEGGGTSSSTWRCAAKGMGYAEGQLKDP